MSIGSSTIKRLAALLVAFPLVLSGCGQGGSPAAANQAADDFLTALVHREVDEAWSHLDPRSQRIVYDNDKAAFASDVHDAEWSQLSWQFGPVVNLDNAWEVHVMADEASVPDFLDETGIAPNWSGNGFIMLVQTPVGQPYLIAAEEG